MGSDHAAVLIADDTREHRQLLSALLESEGHRVTQAANGREAWEMLRAQQFDIVLLDVNMPELDGPDVLRRIRSEPKLGDVPVIMISAVDQVQNVVRCLDLGALDYLPKPFNPDLLRARIRQGLARQRRSDVTREASGDGIFTDGPSAGGPAPAATEQRATIGGERRIATVLFSDLRGFTSFSESRPLSRVTVVINRYLSEMSDVILDHGGTPVSYMGDGIMALFGAPAEQDDHADRAVATSRAMTGPALGAFNEWMRDQGLGSGFRMGVGINSGPVMVGNIGSERRFEYTAIGDTTNTAARLEKATKGTSYSVLISDATCSMLTRELEDLIPVDNLELPGKEARVRVWSFSADRRGRVRQAEMPTTSTASGEATPDTLSVPLQGALVSGRRTEFVGREMELSRLRDCLAGVTDAAALRVVLVAGESGIGKTRLASEFARDAHAKGAVVLFGRSEEEALVPYQPFAEALGHWVEHVPANRLARQLEGRDELVRLLPGLSRRASGLQPPLERDAEMERYRLFESVISVLRDIAATAALVLVLDDLHRIDKPSVLLLKHIVHSCVDLRLMIVCTYRSTEVQGHPFAEAVADFQRDIPIERLALGGLDTSAVAALIAARTKSQPADELVAAIATETEGNPFFVEEVVAHLIESDALTSDDGVVNARVPVLEAGIPDTVREAVQRRLALLSDTTRKALSIASIAGREFAVELVEPVADLPRADFVQAIDEALAAGVIFESDPGLERYGFAHTLVRQTLYEGLSPSRRLRVHHAIAQTLERIRPSEGEYFSELAYHYEQAAATGDAEKAIEYAVWAAGRATEQLAHEEAAAQYNRALHVLDAHAPDAARRCDLLLSLGDAEWSAGEYNRARDAYREAAGIADELRAATPLARAALGYRGALAPFSYAIGIIDDQTIDLLKRALAALGHERTALRARVMAALAERSLDEPVERRTALAAEAIELARETGNDLALADVLTAARWASWSPDNLEQRLAWDDEINGIANATGDHGAAVTAWGLRCVDLMESSRAELVVQLADEGAELVDEAGQRYYHWFATSLRASVALFIGDFARGEQLAEEALSIGRQEQNLNAVQMYAGHLVVIRREQGRLAELEPAIRAYAAQFPSVRLWRCMLAAIRVETGFPEDARRELDSLWRAGDPPIPRDANWLNSIEMLAWACSELEDANRASVLYELLEPYADRRISAFVVLLPCVPNTLGRLARVMRRWDEAAAHFERALEMDQRANTYWLAHTKRDYALALLGRDAPGDRDRAFAMLDEAQEIAGRLGMASLTRKIDQTRRRALGEPTQQALPKAKFAERLSRVREEAGGAVAKGGQAAIARLISNASDAQVERRFGSRIAQRTIFKAMAQSFQPSLAYGFEGEIAYEFTRTNASSPGAKPECWTLTVEGRKASARPGRSRNPALTVRMTLADFVRLSAGELNPVGAMLDRRVAVDGDLAVAARLVEMFGGAQVAPKDPP